MTAPTSLTVTAQATDLLASPAPAAGGSSWLLPVMLVAMVLLLLLPMRRQRKEAAKLRERQTALGPGTKVMTNFGLFGTVVSVDREGNKAVLEVSPGSQVTVHLQTVTTFVEDEPAAETAERSSLEESGPEDAPGSGTSTNS